MSLSLSNQERTDHQNARAVYNELRAKFANDPASLTEKERTELKNTIAYMKMEVFTSWAAVSVADDILLNMQFAYA